MKKIITAIFFAFLGLNNSLASEEVTLDVSNFKTLKAPKSPYVEMGPVDYEGNECDPREDFFEYRDKDETVFESKAGQAFEKFLNRTVVDKKPEDFLKNNLKFQNNMNQY